jgi:hypothetical protein
MAWILCQTPSGLAFGPATVHAGVVGNVRGLPTRRDLFIDERGVVLRVSWHPKHDLVVLSVWHDDHCVGTFQLPVGDVARLSGMLTAALGDQVAQASAPQPAHRAAGSLSIAQRLRLSRAALRLRHRFRRPA